MSNKQRSSRVSRNSSTRTTNTARVAKSRQAVKRKEKMAASNKWMLIVSLIFLAARLIFPDILAVLGSALGGLTILAVAALVVALAATFFGKSVGDFIASLFGGLVGALRDKAGISEDEDEVEVEEHGYGDPRARMARPVAVSYDDDEDYDIPELSVDDEDEEDEYVEPETVRQNRRRPVQMYGYDTVPVAERPVMPKAPVAPVAPAMELPKYELPDGYEWKFVDGAPKIVPIAPPPYELPDGYEWERVNGEWKVAAKPKS